MKSAKKERKQDHHEVRSRIDLLAEALDEEDNVSIKKSDIRSK